MQTFLTVIGIVMHKDRVLILQKSKDDWNYPNKWGFCSGYIKEFEAAESAIIREIKEETILDVKIIKTGKIFEVEDNEKGKCWVIKCFLCQADSDKVNLCHENQSFKWILPNEIGKYDSVPGVKKDLKAIGLLQ